jgi:hypothetical protein
VSKYIKIKVDVTSGEAEATPTLAFAQKDALWRADVLQDLMSDLKSLYDQASHDLSTEFTQH